MATYTVKVEAVCAGLSHIRLRVYKDGVSSIKVETTVDELLNSDFDLKETVSYLCRQSLRDANATTAAQRKAAIEGMVIDL